MEPYRLQLLHAADLEGGIKALEDAPNFSAVVDALSAEEPENTLIVSSGDNYILAPFFAASADPGLAAVLGEAGQGRGDILIANSIGFQAAALGNHEFDQGTATVASLAEFDHDGLLIPDSIDAEVSGANATDEQGVIDTGNFAPNPTVVEVTDALGEVITTKDGNTFGQTEVFLNGARNGIRTQETNLGNFSGFGFSSTDRSNSYRS